MGKFFLRFFLLVLIVVASAIIFLSYFGLETDKFDSFIKSKANEVNENVKLEFNKTKIQLDISDLKLLLKLQNPKVLLKNNEINLSKLDLFLSLKSFYTSDFLLEKATLAFEKNDIKDLTKITNIFLPKIINKQLNKMFAKGNLEGEFIIQFNPDGTVSKNYTFYGKVMESDINITEDYRLKNLTAEVGYGANSLIDTDGLRIIINKGTFLNLELLKSVIDIKFKEIMIFGIVLNITAGMGAFLMGFLDDKLGGKKTIQISLIFLIIAGFIAILAPNKQLFWVAGVMVGIFSGPNQSASRSLMGRFIPAGKENEFFGFYAFSGKMTAFFGPLLLGILTDIFHSQRAGVSIVILLFIIGSILLKTVNEKEGILQAERNL